MDIKVVNQIISIFVIAAQVLAAIIILSFFFPKEYKNKIQHFIRDNTLKMAFSISLAATLGSLFYSEVAGYEPCKLCWVQRIFMYPQVFLLGFALWKKDKAIFNYSLILSVIGGAIALYHYLLQLGIAPSVPCSAVGYSISCSKLFVLSYGYLTIPLMSFTAFVLISLVIFLAKRK